MTTPYQDVFKKFFDLTNVVMRDIVYNKTNTMEDLKEGKGMLENVDYMVRDALEKGIDSHITRAALDSIVGEEYLKEKGVELDFDSPNKDTTIFNFVKGQEAKNSNFQFEMMKKTNRKLLKVAKKIEFLIGHIDVLIKNYQDKKDAIKSREDFNNLLKEMKKEKKDDGTLLFYKKLAGYGNRGEFKSNISFKEASTRKGGRRRRRSAKKKHRKRNLKKRTKRRRRRRRR